MNLKEMIQIEQSKANIITRKIQLIPIGDKDEVNRVYTYLRDGMISQNNAMNQYMSSLYVSMVKDVSSEDRKELNRLYNRISTSKKGSAYDETIKLPKGLPIAGSLCKKVKADFDKAMKSGLKYGKQSLPIYRDKNPLLVHRDYVRLRYTNPHRDSGLYHNYSNHMDFLKHLYKSRDLDVLLKFANNITFKLILGNPHKSAELRNVLQHIFEEYYEIQGSQIGIEGNKIILYLSIAVPTKELELNEDIVVGVDVGLAIPAVCALNNKKNYSKFIGSAEEFLSKRKKIQVQVNRLQKALASNKGGHGRKKKLQPLNKFKKYESNWVRTYNHYVSKSVVDFAIKNKAKYINLEDLSGIGKRDKKQFVLRNWSYYQLQEFITYKAKKVGIIVRKVKPHYTSQTCSCCGSNIEGQRINQSDFICKNPTCEQYGVKINADFNAARNIAMTTEFVTDKKQNNKDKLNK